MRTYATMRGNRGLKWTNHGKRVYTAEASLRISGRHIGGSTYDRERSVAFRVDGREGPYRVDVMTMAGLPWEAIDGGEGFRTLAGAKAMVRVWAADAERQGTMTPSNVGRPAERFADLRRNDRYSPYAEHDAASARYESCVRECDDDLRPNAGRDPRILITFETITPESAEQGDTADNGWIDDEGESMVPDEYDRGEGLTVPEKAAQFLADNGAYEASNSHFYPDTWYTAYETSTDYQTGEVENRSYHLKDFTREEEREVFELMKRR